MQQINQGDILRVEGISNNVYVASKDFFNSMNQIIGCPVEKELSLSPLHYKLQHSEINATVRCENLKMLDLNVRGFSKVSKVDIEDVMEISDIIQSVFDYI